MAKAQWRWGDVLRSATGKQTADNVVHLKRQRTIDDLCDALDGAKARLIEHVNAIPSLREDVRLLQREIADRLEERDCGIEWTIQALPTIDLETLEMTDRPEGDDDHG